jgi:uncharacterized protein YecT (DUF1311 family)
LEKEILRTDSEIDARARTIFRLAGDTTARRKFVAAERAWLVYRRASCTSVADVYRGGTAEPAAFVDCVVSRDRERLDRLASLSGTKAWAP